jgi:hypothetical protein
VAAIHASGRNLMAEASAHKDRVEALVEWMERQGVAVTQASGDLPLPGPKRSSAANHAVIP